MLGLGLGVNLGLGLGLGFTWRCKFAQYEPAKSGNNDISLLGSCNCKLEKREVSEKWERVMGENARVETKFCSIHEKAAD